MFYIVCNKNKVTEKFELRIHNDSIDKLIKIFEEKKQEILNKEAKNYFEYTEKLKRKHIK